MIESFQKLPVVRAFDSTDALLFVLAALALWFAVGPTSEVQNTLGSFGAGTFLSLLVSRYYSKRATEDLRKEADALREETEKLRRHTTLIMRGLEEFAKTGNLKWNLEEGEHIGIAFERSASDAVSGADKGRRRRGDVGNNEDAKHTGSQDQEHRG
jgi:hypothetical protein